jgi:hypothetical protein
VAPKAEVYSVPANVELIASDSSRVARGKNRPALTASQFRSSKRCTRAYASNGTFDDEPQTICWIINYNSLCEGWHGVLPCRQEFNSTRIVDSRQ